MRWIDLKNYVGVDRRKRRPALRFGERRQAVGAETLLTLGAALRQLRVRARLANKPRGVMEFAERARAVSELAKARGEADLGAALLALADQITASADDDWRDRLESVLAHLSQRFDSIR